MEKSILLAKEATRAFKVADHLTYVTFPLLNDQRLFATVSEKLKEALDKGMRAVLEFDYLYKRIQFVPAEFQTRLSLFQQYARKRYGFSPASFITMQEVDEIVTRRKESPIEFIRKDRLVIASGDYRLKTVNLDKIKELVQNTKMFISKVNEIIQTGDRRLFE
ncbi:MAG: hypothetical protein Q8L34_06660 [Candidatus Woesearchaeota archaeon]|nr:hypothetical protein [Candidatus Woesearchaeota archaeon]